MTSVSPPKPWELAGAGRCYHFHTQNNTRCKLRSYYKTSNLLLLLPTMRSVLLMPGLTLRRNIDRYNDCVRRCRSSTARPTQHAQLSCESDSIELLALRTKQIRSNSIQSILDLQLVTVLKIWRRWLWVNVWRRLPVWRNGHGRYGWHVRRRIWWHAG